MGAHARKRQVSTMRVVGGSRANVYMVPDWCGVRSLDPCVRFRTGHVSMFVVVRRWGRVVCVRGPCCPPLFVRIILLLSLLLLLVVVFSMGRYGRVYRLWASASSCAYRRTVLGPGPCDVYRTVFCPTLRSLNVRTYSARVSAPPTSCYTALSIYINSRVSAGLLLSGPC